MTHTDGQQHIYMYGHANQYGYVARPTDGLQLASSVAEILA